MKQFKVVKLGELSQVERFGNLWEQGGKNYAAAIGWNPPREKAIERLDQLAVGDTIIDDDGDTWERIQ